jgi:hypothetical protein
MLVRKLKKKEKSFIFIVSLIDIDKALIEKKKIDPYIKLPKYYYEFLPLYSPDEANKLLSLYREEIDYTIELKRNKDNTEKEFPWGPLYNISRDKFLILRKILIELLDK